MEKRVVIDQITFDMKNGGHVLIRFCKQIVDDDGTVLSEQYHRTSVSPDGDAEMQMKAVNTHLEDGMKVGKVSKAEVKELLDLLAAVDPIIKPRKEVWIKEQKKRQAEAGMLPQPTASVATPAKARKGKAR